MATEPRRQTERLHFGRVSAKGAVYFVTFVTANRTPWLATAAPATAVLGAIRAWHEEGDGAVLAATVMPNHVHVLCVLGDRLDVGRCVSRWKTVGRRESGYAGEWQRDFWERRVRDDESSEDYALYILLNPYRAGLAKRGEAWPWWWAPTPERFMFSTMLGPRGEPPEEWIDWPADKFAELATGE
jgi:REP element-mobilizing transposase RayT